MKTPVLNTETWRSKVNTGLKKNWRIIFHPYVLFFVVALATWLPDGFNIGPINDGWYELAGGETLIRLGYTINFGHFPNGLGLILVGNGFQGWQYVMLAQTALRGALVFEIIRRLFPMQRLFAIACGLIALFHPADWFYFWPGAVGVGFAFVLALAFCLSALVHLDTHSRESLVALYFFQVISCLTYTAFWLLIIGFPVAIWIMRRSEGRKVAASYILKTTALMYAFIVLQAVLTYKGLGREGQIVDLSTWKTLAGFGFETKMFAKGVIDLVPAFKPEYLVVALLPGIFSYVALTMTNGLGDKSGDEGRSWRFYVGFAAGLLTLAVLSYLPYAVSEDRFSNMRQMLAAGILVYIVLLMLVFIHLPRYLSSKHIGFSLIALLTIAVVVIGLEKRAPFVDQYRHQERFLSALAATLPDPLPHSLIIVQLHKPSQSTLSQFDNRWPAFKHAIQFMYGDGTLAVGIIDPETAGRPFEFNQSGVVLNALRVANKGWHSTYDRLIILDYLPDGEMRILDKVWLQHFAPSGTDLTAYNPEKNGNSPGPNAIICTILEVNMRPIYCH